MTAFALECDHDIIIIKSAESLKLFFYEEVIVCRGVRLPPPISKTSPPPLFLVGAFLS